MKLNRRHFVQSGAALVGTAIASKALGQQVCNSQTTKPQTQGPFFPFQGTPEVAIDESGGVASNVISTNDNDLTLVKGHNKSAHGQQVYIRGKITNEKCEPLDKAEVFIWQASETGKYNHHSDEDNVEFLNPFNGQKMKRKLDPDFQYWGRCTTDINGNYSFKTIVPGFYPADYDETKLNESWFRPPHIHFMVSRLGYQQLVTQMYFTGDEIKDRELIDQLNAKDLILQSPKLSESDKKNLIVDFKKTTSGEILGEFNLVMTR